MSTLFVLAFGGEEGPSFLAPMRDHQEALAAQISMFEKGCTHGAVVEVDQSQFDECVECGELTEAFEETLHQKIRGGEARHMEEIQHLVASGAIPEHRATMH